MKKAFILIFSLSAIFLSLFSNAQSLKGGIIEEYIPKGYFGSWGVISKLNSTNNPDYFMFESRDIWTLSGYNNILILENPNSGATSQITIKERNQDGKTLKFKRINSLETKKGKLIHKETVTIILNNKNFNGTDEFTVEEYDLNNKLLKINSANYIISGVRISGKNP